MCATRTRGLDRGFAELADEPWIWQDRSMMARALEQQVDQLEDKSKHGQADRHDAASPVRLPAASPHWPRQTRIPGGTGAMQVTALVATKLLCIVPMIAVYVTAYLGLSILCGFAKPILGTKVLGPVNLGFVLIALNYLVALGTSGDLRADREPVV